MTRKFWVTQLWASKTNSKCDPIGLALVSCEAPVVMIVIPKQVWSLVAFEKIYVKIAWPIFGAHKRSPWVNKINHSTLFFLHWHCKMLSWDKDTVMTKRGQTSLIYCVWRIQTSEAERKYSHKRRLWRIYRIKKTRWKQDVNIFNIMKNILRRRTVSHMYRFVTCCVYSSLLSLLNMTSGVFLGRLLVK